MNQGARKTMKKNQESEGMILPMTKNAVDTESLNLFDSNPILIFEVRSA